MVILGAFSTLKKIRGQLKAGREKEEEEEEEEESVKEGGDEESA